MLRAYRDHYGARPLYYHASREKLLLASDIPALLSLIPDARLDEVAIAEYLATGALTENRTFYEEIKRVPAASSLTAARGGIRVDRYWHPWKGPRTGSLKSEDLDAEFRRLFRRAVQATVADGLPTGVLLSGGPDSSGILGMAAALARSGAPGNPPRVALTMTFDQLRQCDETAIARETAVLHGVPWRSVRVEDISPLYGFDRFLKSFGEPPCGANLALDMRLFEAGCEQGVLVLLDGFDADALFLPSATYLAEFTRRLRLLRLAQEWVSLHRRHRFGLRRLARNSFGYLARRFLGPVRRVPDWINPDLARRVGLEVRLQHEPSAATFEENEAGRILEARVSLTLEPTRILERLYGVERRHPYFDPELIQFLVSIPLDHRFCCGETKLLMRRALGDLLTPSVQRRIDKTKYRDYFNWSLRRHLGLGMLTMVGERSPLDPYVACTRVRAMIENTLRNGVADPALWRMVALERWLVMG